MHAHSLIAPVKPYSDVALDLAGLVLGEMPLDELPTQVDELVHHVAQLMEQVHLVFLWEQRETELGWATPASAPRADGHEEGQENQKLQHFLAWLRQLAPLVSEWGRNQREQRSAH